MGAKKSTDSGQDTFLIDTLFALDEALGIIITGFKTGQGRSKEEILELKKVAVAFKERVPFRVELLSPKNLVDFLALENRTQGIFNQIINELGDKWPDFLNDIEALCFLNPENLAKVAPFLGFLWADEISSHEPLKPPTGWKYLPVEEAVEKYKNIFGSSLNGKSSIERAKKLASWKDGEKIGVWPKFRCFGLGDYLADDEEGWQAYQAVLKAVVSEDGILPKEYKKVFPDFRYKNWREDEMEKFFLTSAGRATLRKLEEESGDDFIIAPANSGFYAGRSVRNSRIKIVLSGNQGPQDAIMNCLAVAVQPERLCANKHLCIDCPGTMFKALGSFSHAPILLFSGCLYFNAYRIGYAYYHFGSSVVRLG